MNPGDEIVLIVDRDNNPIGKTPRKIMRQQGLIHRATYILVFNASGQIFVQKRSRQKDIYPAYLDIAAGGVVLADESYELSAARELREELGLQRLPLARHFDFYHEDSGNRVWGRVFSCRSEGPFVLQKEEVEDGFFMEVDAVFSRSATESFTPDGILILEKFLSE